MVCHWSADLSPKVTDSPALAGNMGMKQETGEEAGWSRARAEENVHKSSGMDVSSGKQLARV